MTVSNKFQVKQTHIPTSFSGEESVEDSVTVRRLIPDRHFTLSMKGIYFCGRHTIRVEGFVEHSVYSSILHRTL